MITPYIKIHIKKSSKNRIFAIRIRFGIVNVLVEAIMTTKFRSILKTI